MRALLPVRTVAPASALIATADAKAHLRIDDDDQDEYVDGLVAAATSWLDGYSGVLGRALITQTWAQSFDGFPSCGTIRLALGPLGAVSSVSYRLDGTATTLSSSIYRTGTDHLGPFVALIDGETWPSPDIRADAVTVTWTCGYGAADDVPESIRQAALLLIGHWYANRETAVVGVSANEVPLAVDALIAPYRRIGL